MISHASSGQGEVTEQEEGTRFVHRAFILAAVFRCGLQILYTLEYTESAAMLTRRTMYV